MALTDDPNDPRLKEGQKGETGQHEIYLVLSEEERAKGFVRPYRNAYVHVGIKHAYHSLDRMLTPEDIEKMKSDGWYNKPYVAVVNIAGGDGTVIGGKYVTEEELFSWQNETRTGGCGTVTLMAREIAETYARNPGFYGATFCRGCNKHLPVREFVWQGTNEIVGS